MPYRDNCQKCVELQAKIDELLKPSLKLNEYQDDFETAACVKCNSALFKKINEEFFRQDVNDERYCKGGGWFSKCPKVEHMHRHCSWCKAEWLERCADQ